MSKELEALNKIQHDFGQLKGQELVSCYETIFNALKRLEAIDNANPSEALKDFERIGSDYFLGSKDCLVKKIYEKEYNNIKQVLLKAQEQEKKKATAWDIVISKNVDMLLIKKYDNVSDYNSAVWLSGREKLTEEEFNLLKEVLE